MSGTRLPPISSTSPRIQLVSMPQLAEAITSRDDWTGIANAAARRRAQTRLNTRAYRRRKAQRVQGERAPTTTATTTTSQLEPLVSYWDDTQQSILAIPISQLPTIYNRRAALLQSTQTSNSSPASNNQIIFPLSPDHLITLLQFNALRALSVNRDLLSDSGLLTAQLHCDVETIHTIPFPDCPNKLSLLPPSLLPTRLQQTIPHPDWIDLFPLPAGRDLLILAGVAQEFDEDELWDDCIGGLYDGYPDDEMERRGFIAWSPPWDISGWEMSEGFVRKWGGRLFGNSVLGEMLEATNRWRVGRGEEQIILEVQVDEVGLGSEET